MIKPRELYETLPNGLPWPESPAKWMEVSATQEDTNVIALHPSATSKKIVHTCTNSLAHLFW